MLIIDGKKTAQLHKNKIKQILDKGFSRKPGLAFILIGEDSASMTYVKMKSKACNEVNIESHVIHLPGDVSQEHLLKVIDQLNHNPHIDGILVQQPFPKHLNPLTIINSIDPFKDVDGFHPVNIGKLIMQDDTGFIPCTPLGILKLLEDYQLSLEGKHVVVIGRSLIVGRPIANLLSQSRDFCNATVTCCHRSSKDLSSFTKIADVLIVAIGKNEFIKADMVKEGCIVIDVGINRIEKKGTNILVGDVDFENVSLKASAITPVPGGVGPMTIAMLLANTMKSFLHRIAYN